MAVNFFNIENKIKIRQKKSIKKWVSETILFYQKKTGTVNIIITNDEYLRKLNSDFLSKDYYTDIISFNFSSGNFLSGDLYISLDRVKENAVNYNVSASEELLRVIIHGVLHLLGFDDENENQRLIMRTKEDIALQKIMVQEII